jgi:LmbE family N-acetylglucosaminyl deacetylase
MTHQQSWHSAVDELPVLRIPKYRRVFVVAPHPDDETLGLGGLIHDWHHSGIDVRVLIVSDGGASHVHSITRSSLVEVRRREALSAAAVLGVGGRVSFLGFLDAGLPNFHDEIAEALRLIITTDSHEGDEGCLLLAPRLGDGHPDHDACARAAAEVSACLPGVEQWSYGVWTWIQPPCDETLAGALRWPISPEGRQAKWQAIGRYASQVTAMLGKQIVTDELLESIAHPAEVVWC